MSPTTLNRGVARATGGATRPPQADPARQEPRVQPGGDRPIPAALRCRSGADRPDPAAAGARRGCHRPSAGQARRSRPHAARAEGDPRPLHRAPEGQGQHRVVCLGEDHGRQTCGAAYAAQPEWPRASKRVTFVELFFDLVFVFAVTQLSHTLLEHLQPLGALQTALLMMAVWWVWIYTSWVTNWLDPEQDRRCG